MLKLIKYFPSPVKIMFYRLLGARIGRQVVLGRGVLIRARRIRIGDNVRIAAGSRISCDELLIGSHVTIGAAAEIRVAGRLALGNNSRFGAGLVAYCRELTIGDFMYAGPQVELGYGSPTPDSRIAIGQRCFLGGRTIVNSEMPVTIGDDVGIGAEVMIWTHGSWGPVLEGFSAQAAPVTIGNRAWLPARTIVLPGVTIGENAVVSINSVVNRDLPAGSLAAGNPARVIKEGMYPKKYSPEKKSALVKGILEAYQAVLLDKGFVPAKTAPAGHPADLAQHYDGFSLYYYDVLSEQALAAAVRLNQRTLLLFLDSQASQPLPDKTQITLFDLTRLAIAGRTDELTEDLRDHLRRKGVKIFTENSFRSITPLPWRRLMDQ